MKKFFLFNLLLLTVSFANSQSLQNSFNDVKDLSLSVSDEFNLIASEYNVLESSTVNEGGWAWRNYNTEKDSFYDLANLSQALGSLFASLEISFGDIANDFANFDGSYSSLSGLPSLGVESITEGGNTGVRLSSANAANHGDIGNTAVDLSYQGSASSTTGATGQSSFAVGLDSTASGASSISGGYLTIASGDASVALGNGAQAAGTYSYSIGHLSKANGDNSVALGFFNESDGQWATSMGIYTNAVGDASTSIGHQTDAKDYASLVLGQYNLLGSTVTNSSTSFSSENTALVIGNGADGNNRSDALVVKFDGTTTIAGSVTASSFIGDGSGLTSLPLVVESITEGGNTGVRLSSANAANHGDIGNTAVDLSYQSSASTTTGATGQSSFAVGLDSTASGAHSISGGYASVASGDTSVALGNGAQATGSFSYSIGHLSQAIGNNSVALGYNNDASGNSSTAMGESNTASGYVSLALGKNTNASANASTAMGESTTASGYVSLALGKNTNASANASTAMGESTTASGYVSLALGKNTTSSAEQSIAAGYGSIAEGDRSTALGLYTTASGTSSTAMGLHTVSETPSSLVIGSWNELNSEDEEALFVIGNGGWDATRENYLGTEESRSNALKVLVDGTTTIAGDLSINSDARLKANIVSLGATLSKLLQIDGKSYTMKKDKSEKQKIGLLAQDIEKVFPELVSESNGIKSVNYQGLVPVLVNAMKEQQRILSEQQSELDELKSIMKKIIERQ